MFHVAADYGISYLSDIQKERIRKKLIKLLRLNMIQVPFDYSYAACWRILSKLEDFNLYKI